MGNFLSQHNPYQRETAVAFVACLTAAAHYFPGGESVESTLLTAGHLGSFAIWFGMQFWVSFVAGLTKVKILPRHWFGRVQRALFHKYFFGGMILNGTMISTFLLLKPMASWNDETFYTGCGLLINGVLTSLNSVVFERKCGEVLQKMHKYEEERGHGDEVGPIKTGSIISDPQYLAIKRDFFKWHGLSSLSNLLSFASSGVHLWYLASRLQF